jgi:quercetin dioxygenase-like cupin family protein
MTQSNSIRLAPHGHNITTKLPINTKQGGQSYILPQLSGESLYIQSTNSVVRLPAGELLTDGSFSVVSSEGAETDPIMPHKHATAHDTFLCLRGSLQVWADDQSRILQPGDFASVPAGVVHSYAQRNAGFNDFIGIIVPAKWEDFFRTLGDPIDQSCITFPTGDQAPFPVKKFAQVMQEGHDVIPQPQHKLVQATPFDQETDKIPTQPGKAYFLKADHGPKFLLAGQQLEIICRPINTENRFSMAWLDGSSRLNESFLGDKDALLRFEHTYTYLKVIEGTASVRIKKNTQSERIEQETLLHGEMALIAPNDAFQIGFVTPYVRLLLITGAKEGLYKGGIETIFESLGTSVGKNIILGGGNGFSQEAKVSIANVQEQAHLIGAQVVV